MSGRNPPTQYELQIRMTVALERIADALERANDLDPLAALERALAAGGSDEEPDVKGTAFAAEAPGRGASLLPPSEQWRTR